jgi:hypothetical protein
MLVGELHPTNLQLQPPPPLLTSPLDQMAQIPHGQIDREIHRQEQQDEEIVPPDQTGDERERSPSMLEREGDILVPLREMPVRGRETAVHGTQGQEDEEEDDVGAEGGDQVDKRQNAHPEEEEGECIEEGWVGEAGGGVGGSVGAVGVVGGGQCGAEGEPVGAVGAEDDEGEGVAQDEFEEAAGEH